MKSGPLQSYFLASVITILSILLQFVFNQQTGIVLIGLLYPMSFLIAWYFGFGPALFSIILSLIFSNFLLFEPYYSFKFINSVEFFRLTVFTVTATGACWIVGRGKRLSKENENYAEKILQLENRFNRSISAINLGVWYCDLPFDVLTWDAQVKDHFWLPAHATVTIETFYERIHPDDREMTRKAIDTAISDKSPYDIVYRTTNPANPSEIKYIRALGWTDYDAKGNPIRFDGVTLDNTRVEKVSLDLMNSLEVVESINKVGTSLSAELNQENLVQQVTDAATQLSKAQFGAFFYNSIDEKGETYTLYTISGVPREKFSSFPMPRKTAVFGPTFNGEGIVRSDDITQDPRYGKNDPYFGKPKGHLPVVSYLAVPVRSRSGDVIGGLFLGHEKKAVFTEREEKIVAGLASQIGIAMDNARLYEKAKESIRLRDEFLSISSHELKTPLTSLKLQLQTFARHTLKEGSPEEIKEKAQKITESSVKQVNRLSSLVDNLLDVSRITHGKLSLNYETTDISLLVKDLTDRYSPVFAQDNTRLTSHVPDGLMAVVDRIRFEQILVNLVTNSLKYAKGSEVEIHLSQLGNEVHLKVMDYGPGIDEKDQKRIFERFERVDGIDNAGLGLGLYIVKQIIVAHGGSINIQSAKGKGAAFEIIIPANPV